MKQKLDILLLSAVVCLIGVAPVLAQLPHSQ